MAVGARIQIPAECQERAGQAGHCDAQVQNGDIRQRLFLAWARGVQAVRIAENQHGILAGKDRTEQGTRPAERRTAPRQRLASDYIVGVQPDQRPARTDYAAGCRRAQSQFVTDNETMTNMFSSPEIEQHPLVPFLPEGARVLMLGSFPPPRERWCMDFFYPNPQNDMWRIMGQVFFGDKTHFEVPYSEIHGGKIHGCEIPRSEVSRCKIPNSEVLGDGTHKPKNRKKGFDYEAIVAFCREQGIAIFDTARAVRRLQGNAADEHLEIVERTDIAALLQQIPECHNLCCTGGKAASTLADILHTATPQTGEYIETVFNDRPIRFWRMPSTSRAYPLSFDKKAAAYRHMFDMLPTHP